MLVIISLCSVLTRAADVPCYTVLTTTCYIQEALDLNSDEKLNLSNINEPDNITEFILEVPSTLNTIPSEIFTQLPGLLGVSLQQASISNLSANHLRSATNLRRLDLSFNKINTIPKNAILPTLNLISLDLSENEITYIEIGAFNSRLLMYLDLSQNKLRSLQKGIFSGARQLRYIFLENNALKTIEDGTLKLPHLKVLSLYENYLKIISPNLLAHAPELQEINLKSNELTEVDAAFERVPKLSKLRLDNNPTLKDLDLIALLDLPALLELRIQNTNLTLPSTLPNQTVSFLLKTLDLSNNKLDRRILFLFLENLELEELILNETGLNDEISDEILNLVPRLSVIEINYKRFLRNGTTEITE